MFSELLNNAVPIPQRHFIHSEDTLQLWSNSPRPWGGKGGSLILPGSPPGNGLHESKRLWRNAVKNHRFSCYVKRVAYFPLSITLPQRASNPSVRKPRLLRLQQYCSFRTLYKVLVLCTQNVSVQHTCSQDHRYFGHLWAKPFRAQSRLPTPRAKGNVDFNNKIFIKFADLDRKPFTISQHWKPTFVIKYISRDTLCTTLITTAEPWTCDRSRKHWILGALKKQLKWRKTDQARFDRGVLLDAKKATRRIRVVIECPFKVLMSEYLNSVMRAHQSFATAGEHIEEARTSNLSFQSSWYQDLKSNIAPTYTRDYAHLKFLVLC